MKEGIVLSLYDYTGEGVIPWAELGYECHCWDIKHDRPYKVDVGHMGGSIKFLWSDLQNEENIYQLIKTYMQREVIMGMAYPVCTDLAVSGAKHFKAKREKNPNFQLEAAGYALWCSDLFEAIQLERYFIENPVSVLSTLWRKPDYIFDPCDYGGYLNENEACHPRWPEYFPKFDAYTKRTCLWTGDEFVMPQKLPVEPVNKGKSDIWKKLGGKSDKTKMIRSATPRGFARAVMLANIPVEGEA